jgi:ATP diphosphatase
MSKNINDLLAIMATLRDPEQGCAWDKAQTYQSIVPYTLEEAYEVADTIERGAIDELPDELGDLLFQVVFYSQIGKEQGRFDFDDCVRAICDKLIRRHPHVFADTSTASAGAAPADATTALKGWEAIKAAERGDNGQHSVLDNVPAGLPALTRAYKLQKRCASVGFDWPDLTGCWDKVREEILEVEAEMATPQQDQVALAEELGDLMFALVNVVRKAGFQPETLLRSANQKFERRFRDVEKQLANQGKTPQQSDLAEMDALWDQVKRLHKTQE